MLLCRWLIDSCSPNGHLSEDSRRLCASGLIWDCSTDRCIPYPLTLPGMCVCVCGRADVSTSITPQIQFFQGLAVCFSSVNGALSSAYIDISNLNGRFKGPLNPNGNNYYKYQRIYWKTMIGLFHHQLTIFTIDHKIFYPFLQYNRTWKSPQHIFFMFLSEKNGIAINFAEKHFIANVTSQLPTCCVLACSEWLP